MYATADEALAASTSLQAADTIYAEPSQADNPDNSDEGDSSIAANAPSLPPPRLEPKEVEGEVYAVPTNEQGDIYAAPPGNEPVQTPVEEGGSDPGQSAAAEEGYEQPICKVMAMCSGGLLTICDTL